MKIVVNAFASGGVIPAQYSKRGGNRSPGMAFADVPRGAVSLVLIVDDPDAPSGLFTHWVVYDIDPRVTRVDENTVPTHGRQGRNSWGDTRYGGPQPPDREHRYFFRLHALDQRVDREPGIDRAQLERAMEGHVIAEAEYMGRYAPHTSEVV
ncbi:YbhB/YbcL family Raf kinase inhibitor-like protein [Opitutus sp. ER46]|uniref:YbhB/YbcL family Raf kinase inhibitor-like protein n=1 Tax=Opitutus sp. ER46 TaxID=2161864 RepID=UPI000D304668|nr:YbhB/YbcL family Raf kinase inhibitor-like protein [Opitutus sp. ER46]PTX97808.1 YbhB/YbcL family Raf kinase inhibitor-like protein [Opitutus sp. ER46]